MSPAPLPRRWRVLRRVAELLVRLLRWDVRVEGLHHVPTTGGAVLAFNHHGYVDVVFAVWDVVRRLRRPVRVLAKAELWRVPLLGRVAGALGAVPVDRHESGSRATAFDAAVGALRAGDLVAVAPEQTISQSFELLPLRTGAARMALAADVPIVPVAGWGSHRAATKDRPLRLRRGLRVQVRYLPPLAPQGDALSLTQALERRLGAGVRQLQEEYPRTRGDVGAWWLPARLGGGAPPHDEVVARHLARFEEEA